jgi:uncharacterized protein (DUF1697 family)
VALLRGVNVGGRSLPMAELRALFFDLGFDDVRSYIQSGNVVFRSSATGAPAAAAIEERLAETAGLDTVVILRTRAQLDKVVAGNPLVKGRDVSKLHVTFLARRPVAATPTADDGLYLPDRFRVVGNEVYVYCPNGYGRTKLNNTFFEKSLGISATTRNWNTVNALARMAA